MLPTCLDAVYTQPPCTSSPPFKKDSFGVSSIELQRLMFIKETWSRNMRYVRLFLGQVRLFSFVMVTYLRH